MKVKEYQAEYRVEPKGFWAQHGIPSRGIALHNALRAGIPYDVFKSLAAAGGLEHAELARYADIPSATLQRRSKAGEFNPGESDRLYRFAEVLNAAIALFEGDTAAAQQWIKSEVKGLGGQTPVSLISTSAGTEAVLDLIGRLEQGVTV